jgi:hypothetical protein
VETVTFQPVDKAIATAIGGFGISTHKATKMAKLANMQFVSDPVRRGAEVAKETPRRSRRAAFQVTMARAIVSPHKATKLAQSADLPCVSDLVRRNGEEKPRGEER